MAAYLVLILAPLGIPVFAVWRDGLLGWGTGGRPFALFIFAYVAIIFAVAVVGER
jgi:hypothetical protein